MSIYYVYAYLRSKGSTIAPKGTPYYIGKGSNGRAYGTHRYVKVPDKSNVVLLEQNLTENKAFEIEKFLIAYHGRKDLGTGVLLNRTDGGEGPSGCIRSEEYRKRMSESRSGEKNPNYGNTASEETRRKKSESMKGKNSGKKASPETLVKLSVAKSGKNNGMYGKEHSEEAKRKMCVAKQAIPIVECPHCGKQGKSSGMTRWHFNNCKNIPTQSNFNIIPLLGSYATPTTR